VWIRDGRDGYHEQSIDSIREMIPQPDHLVVVNDHDHRLGFSGAVHVAWAEALATGADYVFHCELDFTFNEKVDIDRMIGVLERHPEVVQLSLKRQPVNNEEIAAGDFIALHPDDYHEIIDGDDVWLQQRRFFTTNPSLYRTDLCRLGWPQEQYSEGIFTGRYRDAHPDHWFGIWGAKWDRPRVTHIGHQRTGTGY
jgi:glycosyltransferase involved in cell wall biosynthesis